MVSVVYSSIACSDGQNRAYKLHMILSYFKCSDEQIRLVTLRIARPPLIDIMGIISSDNVLTCLGVVHHRVGMREEAIQYPVYETSRDERVDISNGKSD